MLIQHQIYSGNRIAPPLESVTYHELFQDDHCARDHYAQLWRYIRQVAPQLLEAKFREANRLLASDGIAGASIPTREEGLDRLHAFDIIPRIVSAAEWRTVETGLRQRVEALNRFLKDIYGRQNILKDGVVPPELIYSSKDFRHEIMDIDPPQAVYTYLSGIDLIRDEDGRFLVLQDNLRSPSGFLSVIANRAIQRRVLPELFALYPVRQVERSADRLLEALRHFSPRGEDRATIVMLIADRFDPASYAHRFFAKEMGVALVEGKDLLCRSHKVYYGTAHGLRQVDVIYRCAGDESLDSLVRDWDAERGTPGIVNAWRAGNVAIVNAPGVGIADDKAVYAHVPDIIRYYLNEEPILGNMPTYEMTDDQDQAYVLDNLERMVVKAVSGASGCRELIGPASTLAQRVDLVKEICENPRNYVAQPLVAPSRHVCCLDGELESRYLNLRLFVLYGRDIEVIPGGLTRVAATENPLEVISSQGSGSKDTWVLSA